MDFTYQAYEHLVKHLKEQGYEFCPYNRILGDGKYVILRHDVDFDINKAVKMAELENTLEVSSTYFILLSTAFYNIFSKSSLSKLKRIESLGHEIGLHFDEQKYDIDSVEEIKNYVYFEARIIGDLLGKPINVVSMHRPSQITLESDVKFEGLINSYSSFYFKEMKYLSDSRMHWRENILDILAKNEFNRYHILTHPFWYDNNIESTRDKILNFINGKREEVYTEMSLNLRDIEEFITKDEIV